tara:strand:+ start:667 stop:804 length:138 start_codon:yes stop_codon:yes gene_type:complete
LIDKIDTNSEPYTDLAKDGIPLPDAEMYRIIVSKINEIIEKINGE